MRDTLSDPFGARAILETVAGPVAFFRLPRLAELGLAEMDALP